MKKIILLCAIILAIMTFILVSVVWQSSLIKNVLSAMEQKMEFCEIRKYDVLSGRFWMICNGRPYYVEVGSNGLKVEMNGWSFLESQPEVLEELKDDDCRFMHSNSSWILFYCSGKERTYYFNDETFEMKRLGDREFSAKSFFNCTNVKSILKNEILTLEMECGDRGYQTLGSLNINEMSYQLPVVTDNRLTGLDRVRKSFFVSFPGGCDIENRTQNGSEYLLDIDCKGTNLTVYYDVGDNRTGFAFKPSDFEGAFNILASRIFPSYFTGKPIYLDSKGNQDFYIWNKRMLVSEHSGDQITNLYILGEQFG
jgi:hypothetical protein